MAEPHLRAQVQALVDQLHKLEALHAEDAHRIADLERALAESVGYETRHYAETPKAVEADVPSRY